MSDDGKLATRKFNVLLEWDEAEDVWVSYVPALGHLSTYGESRNEVLELTRQAIIGYLEAAAKEDIPVPASETDAEIVELEVATP